MRDRKEYFKEYRRINRESIRQKGREYTRRTYRKSSGRLEGPIPDNDRQRFEKFLVRDNTTGCLNYTGSKTKQGYGTFRLNNRVELAHRVAWVLAGLVIDNNDEQILHNCPGGDNPSCCEISHLWKGTNSQNQIDKAIKNRPYKKKSKLPFGVTTLPNGKFRAMIKTYTKSPKNLHIGVFDTVEEAADAAIKAKNLQLESIKAHIGKSWDELK